MVAISTNAVALSVPTKPTESPIVDQTNTLSKNEQQELAKTIEAEQAETGNQIGILMIPKLEGESIEEYSIQVAREWGIGSKERNSGVLLLIAKDDRQLRIEVGYGLEGVLTDIRAGQIIRTQITPRFKSGNYYAGIKFGLESIIKAIHGEADPATTSPDDQSIPWEALLFIGLFGFSWLGSILARTKSWWAGGVVGGIAGVIIGLVSGLLVVGIISVLALAGVGLLLDKLVSANYKAHAGRGKSPSWWAGGPFIGGGGGSGGGFGGFGGGSFGGGGASGSW